MDPYDFLTERIRVDQHAQRILALPADVHIYAKIDGKNVYRIVLFKGSIKTPAGFFVRIQTPDGREHLVAAESVQPDIVLGSTDPAAGADI